MTHYGRSTKLVLYLDNSTPNQSRPDSASNPAECSHREPQPKRDQSADRWKGTREANSTSYGQGDFRLRERRERL
jgi:hypothetical protein